ncbi:putative ubiquitin ligase [Trypanosoma theileri]|uniref:E3 ubiquitin-protein ligase n=1 Tax=Trypanosoma theileri TaxID=67003 RepID=A0A1X0NP56_9TRYP|nr:putative ubiquitin ligase [Trypanosoma theileri]ORC85949.1 putative ubiquitin ligase [Trypanosoma theileri]
MSLEGNLRPMNPEGWTTRQLISYAELHNLRVPEAGTVISREQRSELLQSVQSDLFSFYDKYSDKEEVGEASGSLRRNDFSLPSKNFNPLAHCDYAEWFRASPEEILKRRAHPSMARWLREHPEILHNIITAGLNELKEKPLRGFYDAGRLPSLEWWLRFTLGSEGEQILEESENTSRVCGKKLSRLEAIVTCLECRVDEQCVLCADCFQNSPCRNHKHVVTHGSGGGICDCGDPGAWNPESFCTKHRGFQKNDDPTASMKPVEKRWLEVETSGLLLYQITIMQKFMQEVYALNSNDDDNKWALSWIDRLLRRTVSDTLFLATKAESTRRMLCIALMQKTCMSSLIKNKRKKRLENSEETETHVFFSCLEEMFLNDIEIEKTRIIIWEESLLLLVDSCISDPLLRVPFAELLLKYGERLSLQINRHVASLSVQVLTAKDVVDALLQRLPHPYWESVLGQETILHRQLSVMLYVCCHIKNDTALRYDFNQMTVRCANHFREVITASENTKALVVSRLLFRAWYKLLTMIGSTSTVQKCDPESVSSERYAVVRDYAMVLDLELHDVLYPIGKMVHSICSALQTGNEPIPQWLNETLLSLPPKWAKVPDPAAYYSSHREVLNALTLKNASTLLYDINNMNERFKASREYMRGILLESMNATNSILTEKRSAFLPKVFVLNGVDDENRLSYYNPQDSLATNPASFTIPHMRFLGVLIKIWERVLQEKQEQQQQQQQEKKKNQKEKQLDLLSGNRVDEYFYSLVSEVFEATQSSAEYWIDECLMPIVLLGQVEQGLWNGPLYGMDERCACYMNFSSLYVETDIYMLQILLLLVPTEKYAIQLLQRHIGNVENSSDLWYSSFLRLILTIATTQNNPAIVEESDLRQALREKMLYTMVTTPEYTFRMLLRSIHGFSYALPGVDCDAMHCSILKEIAVQEHRQSGQVFRVKDAATWRANVNLYHPLIRDQHLYDMHDLFSRLVRRERMMQERERRMEETSQEPVVSFPPPNPKWIENDREQQQQQQQQQQQRTLDLGPEFRHKICLLLQTTAVLSVAIHTIHLYLFFEVKRDSGKSSGHITVNVLIHAITVLYLSMKACKEISSMTSTADSAGMIDWDAVSLFQQQFMPPSGYKYEDLKQLYPVKEIMSAITLKEKLNIPVSVHKSVKNTTTIDALQTLRTYIKEGKSDFNSLVLMLEFILTGVGALSPSSIEAKASLEKTQNEEENQRRQRLKEKQAALLRRVRASDTKSFEEVQNVLEREVKSDKKSNQSSLDGITTTTTTTMMTTKKNHNNNNDDDVDGDDNNRETSSVVARLLFRLAGVECCICRDTTDHPLLLFAHTSSSDTLYRLGFHTGESNEKDVRKIHGNLHLCGHAAHKNCVAKTFGRLARFWELSRNSLLSTNLCPSEFNCPICVMICTTLCPLPALKLHVKQPVSLLSATPSSSLFDAVRSETLDTIMGHTPTAGVLAAMRKVIARASVGLPTSYTKEEVPLMDPTKLQKENPTVWEISETLRCIRYQMYVDLEWVKAGGVLQYNELLTLLSLLISFDIKLLESNAQLLHQEFKKDSDVFFTFLLKVLLNPKEAVTSLVQHTKMLIISCFSGYFNGPESFKEYDSCILTHTQSAEGNNEYNELLIALWRELGCLTLLKVLLVDGTPMQLLHIKEEKITLKPLEADEITTLSGRQRAVLLMLCYLLEDKQQLLYSLEVEDPGTALASLLQSVVDCEKKACKNILNPRKGEIIRSKMISLPYDGPVAWRQCILHHLFHLENTVGEMILKMSSVERCSVCGDTESRRVMCCFCGQRLCARPSFGPPELYAHTLKCGNGVGVYFKGGENAFLVLLAVPGRYLSYPGLYIDEYGQGDLRMFRNHLVTIGDEAAKTWISLWMRSRWGVESFVVRRLVRTHLDRM